MSSWSRDHLKWHPLKRPNTLFALDYDDTFTKDPDLWLAFIDLLKARGHEIVVATMRCSHETEDMDPRLINNVTVYFTCGEQKGPCLHAQNVHPDIWIDDRPDWIVYP